MLTQLLQRINCLEPYSDVIIDCTCSEGLNSVGLDVQQSSLLAHRAHANLQHFDILLSSTLPSNATDDHLDTQSPFRRLGQLIRICGPIRGKIELSLLVKEVDM
jgi:hypothetical protein